MITVLPVARPDFHLAMKWLRWVRILSGQHCGPVVIFAAKSLGNSELEQLGVAAPSCAVLRVNPEYFEHPELGYSAMANHMFLGALNMMAEFYPGEDMLWCESDAIPIKPDWWNQIRSEFILRSNPFMGDFHAPGHIPHMTGNACYAANWREFAPSLANIVTDRPEQGWDSKCAHETVPNSHRTSLIQQTWLVPMPRFTEDNIKMIHPDAVLFHRCKDGSLIDVLAARMGIAPIPLGAPLAPPTPVVQPRRGRHQQTGGVAILIVSHQRDLEMLDYCLRFIRKNARGFAGVVLAVPVQDAPKFAKFAKDGVTLTTFVDQPGKEFLQHLIMKCRADELCPWADHVVHIDSDCMMWRPTTPEDFVKDGKCVMVREDYALIAPRNPNRLIWGHVVERATGIKCTHDLMVRHCNVYPIGLYAHMRGVVERHTGIAFDEYVMGCENGFPQGFCEFVTASAVGLRDMPEKFDVKDYNHEAAARELGIEHRDFQYAYLSAFDPVAELWTHGGMGRYKSDVDQWLNGKLPKFYLK